MIDTENRSVGYRIQAWLRLLRLPNLFTVPGDPLAGYLLATAGGHLSIPRMKLLVAASLFFYAGGLLLNDAADVRFDRTHNPHRPLPQGDVSLASVLLVAVAFLFLGLGVCRFLGTRALLIGVTLVIAIVLYDLGLKRIPVAGVFLMGICRGLSLLLGASDGDLWAAPVTVAAFVVVAYITAVTMNARCETCPDQGRALSRWSPFVVLASGMVLLVVAPALRGVLSLSIYSSAIILAGATAIYLGRPNTKKPAAIGWLISLLIFVQAALILDTAPSQIGHALAASLAVGWLLNRWLTRFFYAS